MQLKTQKPKFYEDVEIEYGCIYCCINDCKYKTEFYYRTGEYLVTDGRDTIIKRIVVNST